MTKLTATTPLGTFSRSTDRPYTHVVVAPVNQADLDGAREWVARAEAELAEALPRVQDFTYHSRYDGDKLYQNVVVSYRRNYQTGEPEVSTWCGIERYQKDVKSARKYQADLIDRFDKGLGLIHSWHSSRDLAEKAATSLASKSYYQARGTQFRVFSVKGEEN